MAETLQLKISGLYLNPNTLGGSTPEGALNQAMNVVIDRDSVADTRRGQAQYGLLNWIPEKFFQYDGHLLANGNNQMALDSDQNGTFTYYSGDFTPPEAGVKMRSLEQNQNLYITSAIGIQKLDSVLGTFIEAGGITALNGTASLTAPPGFMSDDTQVAYRMVWGYVDANDNEIIGVPSQRLVVVNDSGDTANVEMTWYIPQGITESYFYRVYRSAESAGAAFPPDDDLQQVKEGYPDSTDISNGYFEFTDIVPNSLRGATLYTSPSQQGIQNANYPPPFALDMTLFRDCVFYFNTKSKQRYFGSLVSVGDNTLGGSFGYQTNNGDTHTNTTIDGLTKAAEVTIQDLTYTADTPGVTGNSISITYTGGGTAGAEVVTVTDSAISVQIQSGVSTATQVKTAVDGSVSAAALVDVTISGTGSDPQTTVAQTFLEDGFDTTYLNVGMRVVGTGVVDDTRIESIDSSSSITVTIATLATATVALEFQDRFSINDMDYWAASTEDYDERQFEAELSGTPGENITNTTLNLIAAINLDPNNSIVYAYYESGPTDLPGTFLIEERGVNSLPFSITSTNGESFSPALTASGMANISDNDAKQNRVMFSKIQQPEAVPLLNFLPVGSENFPIIRGIALRDSIFVFKPGEGIFRITGTDASNFNVSLFDSSAQIKAPESAVVLNNQIFTFSDQGIIAVSENGVQILSRPIETTLLELSSPQFENFETASFGMSYESDRKYFFYTVQSENDAYAQQAFVFNTITNTWTQWPMPRSCGLVLKRDNKIYMGNPDNLYVYQERKNYNRTDYADDQFNVVITAFDGLEVSLDDTSLLTAGDLLKQGAVESLIVDVVDATTVLVSTEEEWALSDAIVYEAIETEVEWVPNTAANPGILKHFFETTLLFKGASFQSITAGFQTDIVSSFQEVELPEPSGQGWGQFPWGEAPWGIGGGNSNISLRTYVPLEAQRGSWLNFKVGNREAYSSFSLAGVSAQYNDMTSRQR